ncbi:hypothetical protein, partial [Anaerostipes sp.]|uniref:hypothetical protein n=1 Tax=Anaerostipes sp. TaxID=1872530 RepID=UPI0025859ED6
IQICFESVLLDQLAFTIISLELFILSLELFILCILNEDEILIYLKHSFSYIFFNPLFSEKQPLTRFVSGLFIVRL